MSLLRAELGGNQGIVSACASVVRKTPTDWGDVLGQQAPPRHRQHPHDLLRLHPQPQTLRPPDLPTAHQARVPPRPYDLHAPSVDHRMPQPLLHHQVSAEQRAGGAALGREGGAGGLVDAFGEIAGEVGEAGSG